MLAGIAASGAGVISVPGLSVAMATPTWRMPDEAQPHAATWMAFGPSDEIWGKGLKSAVQDDLARIAKAISKYEPVKMLVRVEDYETAQRKCGPDVALVVKPIDDLWIRDTGPVFVRGPNGHLAGIDFNFNGWGGKQAHDEDATVAEFVCAEAGVAILTTKLILEGGGLEVDGEGTAIISESCVLNRNRNPGVSKARCEAELGRLLGLSKIIWIPGIAGRDITDGHTDFYVRFAGPGVVVVGYDPDPKSFDHPVTLRNLEILRQATDAKGRRLRVVVLQAPGTVRPRYESDDFAAGYINFYVCNGGVIAPEFGDKVADGRAKQALEALFPDRDVVQINIDAIAAGGGGIHCATQQQPKAA